MGTAVEGAYSALGLSNFEFMNIFLRSCISCTTLNSLIIIMMLQIYVFDLSNLYNKGLNQGRVILDQILSYYT